ncbi:MAG: HU family DNA-binding protein [Chloroflexi bacterium]|jgi:predicted histone-like DNA-binding protein|nr:HU family DNA-binding protein [Chloroflexota bacterium]
MSIKYNVVARKNPRDQEAPPKYYPSIQSTGRTSVRQLAERMAEISTLSTIDTMAAIEAFLQVVPQELTKGNIVDLGDFGSFWLRTKSDGTEVESEVKKTQIGFIKPQFRPGKEFQKVLNNAEFKKG